ncbi:MAG: hypothetical protein M0R06_25395 [Sphaerochaeta sp.]|nr:hypothetical protein [Sphaerochaeta sp.]
MRAVPWVTAALTITSSQVPEPRTPTRNQSPFAAEPLSATARATPEAATAAVRIVFGSTLSGWATRMTLPSTLAMLIAWYPISYFSLNLASFRRLTFFL